MCRPVQQLITCMSEKRKEKEKKLFIYIINTSQIRNHFYAPQNMIL